MSVFSDFLPDFPPGCTTNQSKQNKKFQRNTFLSFILQEQCVNLTFSKLYRCTTMYITGTVWHSDAFILFTFARVVLDQRPQNIFSKSNAPCVLLLLRPMRPFLNGCSLVGACFLGFLLSSSLTLVSWTRHIWRWLSSIKLNATLMFIGCILQPHKKLENNLSRKCQRMITRSMLNDRLYWQRTHTPSCRIFRTFCKFFVF